MRFFIGTDVGGTFTDLWVADQSGKSQVLKFPTTADVMGGVIAAVRLAAEAYDLSFEEFCAGIEKFGHGTTVGLNALLTGRAAKTGIVTTLGFGDTLEIGRIRRQTSGLSEAIALLTNLERVGHVRFRHGDVVRHDLVRQIVEVYESAKPNAPAIARSGSAR